jgi:Ca2+-transporting ATPase
MRTLVDLQKLIPTSPETGLPQAEVARSRLAFGANRLTPLPRQPVWHKFLEKFDEPIIKILLAAALLSMVVDLFKADASLGATALGFVAGGVLGALTLRRGEWVPSLLFGLALAFFLVGALAGRVLVEGMAVMVAVLLATGVAFANEFKSDREFELLNARKASPRAKVIRGEIFLAVPPEEVVVGDLVVLEAGDEVPADGRLVKAAELHADQSLLTGEPEPAPKQARPPDDAAEGPEQPGCLYRGTQVVDGLGRLLVTEVGDATYLGQVARQLSADDRDADEGGAGAKTRVRHKLTVSRALTPLQLKLARLAGLISRVGYFAAGLIFLAQLVHGLLAHAVHWPATGREALDVLGVLLGYFVTMVIVIVVAVPEGLPMSVTVSLALAMQKMARANALVRQLVACETVGSATVICCDKTGTLTQNRMQVVRSAWGGRVYDRDTAGWDLPAGFEAGGGGGTPLDWLVLNAAVNSTAHLEQKEGRALPVGNSTEGALLLLLHEAGMDYRQLRARFGPLYQVHFTSERKRMTTVIRRGGELVALVKGAPEWVLERSTHYLAADADAREWTPAARAAVDDQLRDTTGQAMRVLAFGYVVLRGEAAADGAGLDARREAIEQGLVYAGFVAIRDPLRQDVKDALARCRRAGIEVKMVTGDNPETARAVGGEIGLLDRPDALVLTSQELGALTDEEVKGRLPRLRILARARPLDKLRLVKLLQERGEVVAVTGDGTNDAPALKKADVGLAMGVAGTEVAKEASKIVLLDDSFATIVRAVHWGRALYENIQRFVQFQLTINVSALAVFFLGTLFFQAGAPFTVLQLLWINVIMDTLASIALCSEPPRPGVMRLPPKRKDENILTPAMVRTILLTAGFLMLTMLGLLVLMKGTPARPGLFAGDGPWSVAVGGTRVALPADALTAGGGDAWRVNGRARDFLPGDEAEALVGREAEVSLTVLQVSLFFSAYVLFQVWNQINCRSLTPAVSGFHRLTENPTFLVIAGVVAAGQVVIVTFGGPLFNVEPLGAGQWLAVAAGTASVLVFAEAARRLRLALRRGAA